MKGLTSPRSERKKGRYETFTLTGHLIDPDGSGRPRGTNVGSREWDAGPLTTWYIWDKAECRTLSEHGSSFEANAEVRRLLVLDEEWEREHPQLEPLPA